MIVSEFKAIGLAGFFKNWKIFELDDTFLVNLNEFRNKRVDKVLHRS
jgi:hypothetical protein